MLSNIDVSVPFVDLRAQHATIRGEIDRAISHVIETTSFILGDAVTVFEAEFAAYCGVKYAVGVDSGTSALELILRAYDIGPGDEVITAANTFIATVLAISNTGATPVLVDINPQTYNLEAGAVEAAITPRTRAVIPVHLYGQPVDMDPLVAVTQKHGLVLIEDACQAHGAEYKGRRAGSIGHAAAFSFYPAKNLGACGDGGMVVTDDARITDRLKQLRNYGQRQKYHHETIGYNRRLDTIQAAILSVKLKYIDAWNEARRRHAASYSDLLAGMNAVTPEVLAGADPVWHLYVVQHERRDALQRYLADHAISTGIHYPIPIHLQPAYKGLGYERGQFPVTERCAERILSLPMYAELTEGQVARVVEMIDTFEREQM